MSNHHQRKQQAAVILIQRHVRGFLGRKEFNHRVLLRERDRRKSRSSQGAKHRNAPSKIETKSNMVMKSSSSPRQRREVEDWPVEEEEVAVYKAVKKVALSKPIIVSTSQQAKSVHPVASKPTGRVLLQDEDGVDVGDEDSLGGGEDDGYKHSLQRIEEDDAEMLKDSLNNTAASRLLRQAQLHDEHVLSSSPKLPKSKGNTKEFNTNNTHRMSKEIDPELYDSLEISRSSKGGNSVRNSQSLRKSQAVEQQRSPHKSPTLQLPLDDDEDEGFQGEDEDIADLRDSLDMYSSASKMPKKAMVGSSAVLASPMYRPQVAEFVGVGDDEEYISPRYHEEEVYESDDSLNEQIRKQSANVTKKPVMNMTNMSNKSTSKSTIRIGDSSNSPPPHHGMGSSQQPAAAAAGRTQIPRYQPQSSSATKAPQPVLTHVSINSAPSSSSPRQPVAGNNNNYNNNNYQVPAVHLNPPKASKLSVRDLLLASPPEESMPSARSQHGNDSTHASNHHRGTHQQQPPPITSKPPENKLDSLKKMYDQNIARYFPGSQPPQHQRSAVSGDPYSSSIQHRPRQRDYDDDDMMPVQPRRGMQVDTDIQQPRRNHYSHENQDVNSPLDDVNRAMLGRRSHPTAGSDPQGHHYDQAPPISGRDPYNPNRNRQQPNQQQQQQQQQPNSAHRNESQQQYQSQAAGHQSVVEGGQRRQRHQEEEPEEVVRQPRYSEPPQQQQPRQQFQPPPREQKRPQPQPQYQHQEPQLEPQGYGYQYSQNGAPPQQQQAPNRRKGGEVVDLPQLPAQVNNPSVQQPRNVPPNNNQQRTKPKPAIHESQEMERKLLEEIAMLDMKKAAHSSGVNKMQEVEQSEKNRNAAAPAVAVAPKREKKVDETKTKEKKAFGWGARDFREKKESESVKPSKPVANQPAAEIVKEWKQAANYDQQPEAAGPGRQGRQQNPSQGPPQRNQAAGGYSQYPNSAASVVSSISGNEAPHNVINMPQYIGAQPSSYLNEFSKRKQGPAANNRQRSLSAGRDRRAPGNGDAQSVQSHHSQHSSKKNHAMESASLPPLLPYYSNAPAQPQPTLPQQGHKHPLDNASRRVDSRHSTRSAPH